MTECPHCTGWGVMDTQGRVGPCPYCSPIEALRAEYQSIVNEGIKPEEQRLLDKLK
jgi:hypothetical protein